MKPGESSSEHTMSLSCCAQNAYPPNPYKTSVSEPKERKKFLHYQNNFLQHFRVIRVIRREVHLFSWTKPIQE